MTKFSLEFDTGNSAFEGDFAAEVAFILKTVSGKVSLGSDDGVHEGIIQDSNGNRIGSFCGEEPADEPKAESEEADGEMDEPTEEETVDRRPGMK